MQQAMDTVIKELGSDAVILNSRKVRKKGFKNMFSKPVLEVMVAYDPANIPSVKKLNIAQPPPAADKIQKEQKNKRISLLLKTYLECSRIGRAVCHVSFAQPTKEGNYNHDTTNQIQIHECLVL